MSHNFADILFRNLDNGRGGRVAVCCGERRLTYDELAVLTKRVANGLSKLRVERKERVALLMFDCPELIASFYGAATFGAIPIPFNTMLSASEYEYMLNHSQARVAIVSGALYCQIESIRAKCPFLKDVVLVGATKAANTLNWESWLDGVSSEAAMVDVLPDEPAFWLYSSGSTGRPKAVVHSHDSIAVTCRLYAEGVLGLRSDDITFSAAKIFHAYGLGNGMNFPLYVGATTVLNPGPPLPEMLFEIIARFKPAVFYATPSLFVGMLEAAESGKKYDLKSVRFCVSAGEALPSSTFLRWKEKFGIEILDGIGSSEMLHIFISNRPGEAVAGSTGKVVEGYQAKIVGENGQTLSAGEVGDLWVSGGSSFKEYWDDRERTEATLRGEWVVTGDKYRQDETGRFWYQGRADDMLKVNSLWVSPFEIENILNHHPDVLECAVVGIRDEHDLMQVKAFVVLKADGEGTPTLIRKLQTFVKQKAPQRCPKLFEFVAHLPKTAAGKIKRFELRGNGLGSVSL